MKKLLTIALFSFAIGAHAEDSEWKPRSIGFLVLEGVYNTELVAARDPTFSRRIHFSRTVG